MIKLNNKEITIDQLENIIKKKMWIGDPISNIAVMDENLNFKTHPYAWLFIFSTQLSNEGGHVPKLSFSWKVKIFLINRMYDIRKLLRA